ncbi:MAG: hypothetical protein K0R57_2374 [Paenibacillaceae bacterium]|jgi:putative aldouronate transport system substrate-binding protein|nr:hypothetical protein [Paenibacillaceae bacterium]
MKIKKGKCLVTVMLASALALSACSGNDNTATEGNSSQSPGNTAEAPVTVKIMGQFDEANLAPTDKKFVEQLEQLTNTKLEFIIPPSTGYKEQLQLALATGDLPDLLLFTDINDINLRNAVDNGTIIPVNDYLKAAPNLLPYSYEESWKALRFNGDDKIYGIPRTSIVREDSFFVRQDWLDRLGIALPANHEVTIDTFKEIMRRFTKDDPDGDGKSNTYGFALSLNGSKVLGPMLVSQYGLLGWQEASGGAYKYTNEMYAKDATSFKKALAFTADLYKERLLDPDSGTLDSSKANERFQSGVTGVKRGFVGGLLSEEQVLKKVNPNAELTYLFVQNEQGKVQGAGSGAGMFGAWVLTKTSKHPQKAVDVLNAVLSDDVWPHVIDGYEGIDYTVENGQKVQKESKTSSIRRNMMRRSGDPEFFIAPGTSAEIRSRLLPWLDKAVSSVVISKSLDHVPAAAKTPAFMDYQKQWDQTVMKIIVGQLPVDAADELVKGWYEKGGEVYTQEMNKYIEKMEGQ